MPRSLLGGFSAAGGMALAFTALTAGTYGLGSILVGYESILEFAGGIITLVMGIFMMMEFQIFRLPSSLRAPARRGLFGLFSFGALWGVVEIVCTPALFISVLVFAITQGIRGTLSFIGFAFGMILPIIMLAIFTARGRRASISRLMQYVPTLQRISSLVLFVLGVILVSLSLLYYGVI